MSTKTDPIYNVRFTKTASLLAWMRGDDTMTVQFAHNDLQLSAWCRIAGWEAGESGNRLTPVLEVGEICYLDLYPLERVGDVYQATTKTAVGHTISMEPADYEALLETVREHIGGFIRWEALSAAEDAFVSTQTNRAHLVGR